MIKFPNYKGRLISMQERYAIYDREDDNIIIGYTEIGDMYVVTYESQTTDYFEGIIVSGTYVGVDTLALTKKDLDKSIFVLNNIDNSGSVYVNDTKEKYEYR